MAMGKQEAERGRAQAQSSLVGKGLLSVLVKGCWDSEIKRGLTGLLEWEIFIMFHINTNVSKKRNRNLKRHVDGG